MRAKELRLALVCYGGISLAVYMHGVTKELWRLLRASRGWHAGDAPGSGTERVYTTLLTELEAAGTRLSVLTDIVAGASAGGINGLFLAQAIASGQSLEPLTALWLDSADVDVLLAPNATRLAGVAKMWAAPLAWLVGGRRGGVLDRTVEPAVRDEVRGKLTRFLAARPFQPPFSGDNFTDLLFASFEAMAAAPAGPPLLPPAQPLDLFVTVTDFHGHPERLRLHSPAEVVETEHRLILSYSDRGTTPAPDGARTIGDVAELVFAARATASFPGAFPPFAVAELDRALARRGRSWPGRDAFLARALPRHAAADAIDAAVLIDGSVLANAPFRPCIDALRNRPAGREVDRRFVYVDPKPGVRSVQLSGADGALPGFFRTIFGALSDIPREQPIRDNLEALATRSDQVARTRAVIDAIRPEVEATIESSLGGTYFLDRPTPARLAAWRAKANALAAKGAGYAYASYRRLKLAGVEEELAALLSKLTDLAPEPATFDRLRDRVATATATLGLSEPRMFAATGAGEQAIRFFRAHDLGFRIRRLRFLAAELARVDGATADAQQALRDAVYRVLGAYLDREQPAFFGTASVSAAALAVDPAAALDAIAAARDLRGVDDMADAALADALAALPRPARRAVILLYLGFAFYDVATLPLLGATARDEFNPVRVDRIAPDDAVGIRTGGAEATLKGIQFNSFGAFFSRAYRENDYLWGRLHGAERLIDIVLAALPAGTALAPGRAALLKRDAFRAILAEERTRLTAIPELFTALAMEIG